jgi:copper chaperone CopZ
MSVSSEKTYRIGGMTCEHCERALRDEVELVPGVRAATADHVSGRLLVRGEGFDDDAIVHAVDTAGFELVA